MEEKTNRSDNGISEQARLNQMIAYLYSGKADSLWKERFDAYLDHEVRNGHTGAMRDMMWNAMLALREEQIFLNGHSSEQRIEKIGRLIGLLQDRDPPAAWLNDFEKVFTERRRLDEKDKRVQGRLLDLAVAADCKVIRLDPNRWQGNPWSKKGFNEYELRRKTDSGEWKLAPADRRMDGRPVPYPLQERRARRRV